jgi:hypothetical protein
MSDEFDEAVNMTASELERWLATDESRSVGQPAGGRPASSQSGTTESVGHESGRHIVRLLRKNKAELPDDDQAHMRKVVGYIHRHLAQRPDGGVEHTRWRYSLMNWGHDPLKD